jgi:flagellin-specific chaperone FliS
MEKGSAIVIELKCTLNHDVAPELCQQLADIYGFVVGRLVQAALQRNVQFVNEAERAFAPVAEGFIQAVAQVEGQAKAAPAPAAAVAR